MAAAGEHYKITFRYNTHVCNNVTLTLHCHLLNFDGEDTQMKGVIDFSLHTVCGQGHK